MTGYERIMNTIEGKTVDHTPVWPFVMTFAAKYAGVPYGAFASDYREMAKALIKTAEDFDLDAITVDSDAYREATACGAEIVYPYDELPYLKANAIREKEKFSFRQPIIENCPRLVDKIEGVRKVKEYFKEDKAVAGWIEAPLQCAGILYPMDEFMTDIYEDPHFIEELVAFTTELGTAFAVEQVKAGADIIGIGDAMASLVSPAVYEEYFLPATKRLVQEIRRKVKVKLKYHICGQATHLLKYSEDIGFDIVNIDYLVDMETAFEMVHGKTAIKGNINPVTLMTQTPEEIYKICRNLLTLTENKKFILSPGCEAAKNTPVENMKAMVRSTRI